MPEVPKKPVPKEKVPVAEPKEPEAPPAKGMTVVLLRWQVILYIYNIFRVNVLHVNNMEINLFKNQKHE